MNWDRFLSRLILGVMAVNCLAYAALPQNSTIQVEAEIVAFDKLSTFLKMTNVPPTQLFLIKVSRVNKGRESEKYIFVRQHNFDDKTSLLNKIENGKHHFKMTLKREAVCDASITDIGTLRRGSGSNTSEDIPRIKWLRNAVDVSVDKRFNCYILKGGDYKALRKDR